MDTLVEVLGRIFEQALERLYEILITVILETLVNFFQDVVEYFKQLSMERNVHVPFMMKTDESNTVLGDLIPDELKGEGILEGVYNKNTDTLESLRYVGGKGLGADVNEAFQDESVIVFN